ncbi:ABC transporter substrate-binding protein [Streptomyces sp. ISL-10]|uniref:ABC transporter substrate-binding protein n=1 Tax=Streptomyces sp. ISL-10 TaxID=2819172 RepID=UPI001BE805EA|nr:ABC transporter substrate-binding protein [Streptomyces sp. ISL-10]MBT2364701.1 ABC transporter substrate-binding protein [Streptomyces sp. ISL-10]
MTGRRRSFTPRPSKTRRVRAACITAVATVASGACLVAGCGVLPGDPGGSREPVTVMTFAPEETKATNMPGMMAMAKAYERWTDARGGIDGHDLRVITCNEKNTPQGAALCARRAVKEGAVAVVGSYSQYGSFMAPLEAAGIPFIGGYGLSAEEFTSYLSYPVNGGQPALVAGNGRQLADSCAGVSLVRPDSINGDDLVQLLNSGLKEGGQRIPSADVLAADDATEYTSQAEQARRRAAEPTWTAALASGARPGCVTAALGDRTETFFDSFRRLPEDGRHIRISSVIGSVGQPLVDRTGGRKGPFEGAYITSWYPDANDERWDGMHKVVTEHAFGDDRIDPADAGVQTTWIAYTVLERVIRALDSDEITPGRISHALDQGLEVTTDGLTPPLRWGYEDMLGAPGYPRIVNRSVTFQVVRDGRLVAQAKDFVDVGDTLMAAS